MASPSTGFSAWRRRATSVTSQDRNPSTPTPARPRNIADAGAFPTSGSAAHREPIRSFVSGSVVDNPGEYFDVSHMTVTHFHPQCYPVNLLYINFVRLWCRTSNTTHISLSQHDSLSSILLNALSWATLSMDNLLWNDLSLCDLLVACCIPCCQVKTSQAWRHT